MDEYGRYNLQIETPRGDGNCEHCNTKRRRKEFIDRNSERRRKPELQALQGLLNQIYRQKLREETETTGGFFNSSILSDLQIETPRGDGNNGLMLLYVFGLIIYRQKLREETETLFKCYMLLRLAFIDRNSERRRKLISSFYYFHVTVYLQIETPRGDGNNILTFSSYSFNIYRQKLREETETILLLFRPFQML